MMPASLRFEGVSKSFSREIRRPGLFSGLLGRRPAETRQVLADFSADIRPGEKVFLQGANGTGKSTILKLAIGLCRPDGGRVTIAERDAAFADRSRIGVMFSNQLLYGTLSGYQNLELSARLYGCDDVAARVMEAGERWHLKEFIHSPVDGYSSGMRSVLALARATLHDPDLLLLDEPTTFLDQAHQALLVSFLKDSRATILCTGQQRDVLQDAAPRTIAL